MILNFIQRIKDAAVFMAFPLIPRNLQRARSVGLETLLDYQRLAMLVAAVRYTAKVSGDVTEFGSFRGGSAGLILQEIQSFKTLHVFDSFEGMPDIAPEDNFHKKGDFDDTEAEQVRTGLSKLRSNFQMHVGFFQKTIPEMSKNKSLEISLAHIDADLYESVKLSLEFCYSRMENGGVIIFDDYGAPTCLGAKRAVDDFFAERPEKVVPLTGDQHGCVIGGGDLFDILSSNFPRVGRIPALMRKVFHSNYYKSSKTTSKE